MTCLLDDLYRNHCIRKPCRLSVPFTPNTCRQVQSGTGSSNECRSAGTNRRRSFFFQPLEDHREVLPCVLDGIAWHRWFSFCNDGRMSTRDRRRNPDSLFPTRESGPTTWNLRRGKRLNVMTVSTLRGALHFMRLSNIPMPILFVLSATIVQGYCRDHYLSHYRCYHFLCHYHYYLFL